MMKKVQVMSKNLKLLSMSSLLTISFNNTYKFLPLVVNDADNTQQAKCQIEQQGYNEEATFAAHVLRI